MRYIYVCSAYLDGKFWGDAMCVMLLNRNKDAKPEPFIAIFFRKYFFSPWANSDDDWKVLTKRKKN